MARRYQKGHVFLRGKNKDVWYGRWREDVQNPNGGIERPLRNVRLGTKEELPTKRMARRALDEHVAKVNDLDYHPQSTITMRQFATTWLEEVLPAGKKTKSSVHSMGSSVRNHVIPFFGNQPLAQITPQHVQKFINHLNAQGLMPRSVMAIYMALRSVWRTALLWGKVKHDPFPRKGIELPKIDETDRQPFTEDETRAIIEAANEPDKTLFWLMAETGLRAGEVLALQKRDIDFTEGVVRVRKNWCKGEMGAPKSKKGFRNPALSPELIAHLHSHYATASGETYLVPGGVAGKPLSYASFLERLHKVLDRLGIVMRGFHGFRYTSGTVSIAEGVDPKVLQERLGHSNPSITLALYARKVSAGERALAAKLGAKFVPTCSQTAKSA